MLLRLLIISFFSVFFLSAKTLAPIDFKPITMGDDNGKTLLLLGGIQGDEPGGFNAVNVFLMTYKISHGKVIAVPSTNIHSMLLNHRGIYGDLNRKFATLSPKDKEYGIIQHIKSLITRKDVDFVLHLHDGSGFFRPTYIDAKHNPNRWGNCTTIDQQTVDHEEYGDLVDNADKILSHINANLLEPDHKYHLHNTHTKKGDKEMLKALTYFAITHNKAAIANEASKELTVAKRVYYHLLAVESVLKMLDIHYERPFKLTPLNIYRIMFDKSLTVDIDGKMTLPMFGLRPTLNYFPLPEGVPLADITLESRAHILGLLPNKDGSISLKYGNRVLTRFKPFYTDFKNSLDSVSAKVDGVDTSLKVGTIVKVKKDVFLEPSSDYRINIIGYVKPNSKELDDTGVLLSHKDMIKRFSIDKAGMIYRAEIYSGEVFRGMVLLEFGGK
ncbi:M99 family carboxypeptidase catalytic domain-containing protein [Helicobacter sp. 11S02629-2]|uniref:M99 family carboxypeptidase catalytic domain-containing protein n=1 Tax=Helicobacter sp. 11S02629-2 TaxID=1476195 RepID=UPI000BA564F1|nr:M99 family carboxypeptidase catalytic domain-containing protein [Helicobacter sp. 11S02629-2]PAF41498.1 purine-nucleoside phosphorylase [Helicobacter sp. 11S02629-2]